MECPYCSRKFADQNGMWLHARAKHRDKKTAHLRPEVVDDSMGAIFREMKAHKKEAKAARVQDLDTTLERIADTGASVKLLDGVGHHYRITSVSGASIDFWGSTQRWLHTGTKKGGGGINSLLRNLTEQSS